MSNNNGCLFVVGWLKERKFAAISELQNKLMSSISSLSEKKKSVCSLKAKRKSSGGGDQIPQIC